MSHSLRSALGLVLCTTLGVSAAPPAVDALGDPLPPGALVRYGTLRLRHNGLSMLLFTADGKRLLTFGGNTGFEMRLWDVKTGQLVDRRRLAMQDAGEQMVFAPDGGFYTLAPNAVYHVKDFRATKKKVYSQDDLNPMSGKISPDGKILAVAQGDGGVTLLDVPEGKVRMQLKPPAAAAGGPGIDFPGNELAFSQDGRLMAQASMTGQIVLWDLTTRKQVHTYDVSGKGGGGPEGGLVHFSPDGKHLLVQSGQQLRLFPTTSTTEVAGFKSPADPLMQVRFSGDGKELIAIDHMGKLARYDAMTGKDIATNPLPVRTQEAGGIHQAAFSPDAGRVAVVLNASIYVVDTRSNKLVHDALPNREALRSVRRVGGTEVMSLTLFNQVQFWDATTGKFLRTQQFAEDEVLAAVDPTGKRALVQTPEQPARLIQLSDKKELWKLEGATSFVAGQFSPDGRWLITTTEAGIDVRDARTGKTKRSWANDAGPAGLASFGALVWSPTCRLLAQVEPTEGKVSVHEFGTGQVRYTFTVNDPAGVAFCPKGRHVSVQSADGVVRVFKLGQAEPLFEVVVRGGGGGGMPIALSARAAIAGAVLGDGIFPAGMGAPTVAFSPDGQYLLATCATDVRVWDMTGKPVGIFRGHDDAVSDLEFAPDGKTFTTASHDGTALVWDMKYLDRKRDVPAAEPTPAEKLWQELAADDGARAGKAITQLQDKPEAAVALLGGKLVPTRPVDARVVTKLIEDLDSDEARLRKQAVTALEALDVQVEAALNKAREATRSAEVRRAIGRLLDRLDAAVLDGDRLREVRAVEVLEAVGTPAAQAVLVRLVKGADSRQTREAKEALARLAAKAER